MIENLMPQAGSEPVADEQVHWDRPCADLWIATCDSRYIGMIEGDQGFVAHDGLSNALGRFEEFGDAQRAIAIANRSSEGLDPRTEPESGWNR